MMMLELEATLAPLSYLALPPQQQPTLPTPMDQALPPVHRDVYADLDMPSFA